MLYAFLALCLVGAAHATEYPDFDCQKLEVEPAFNISRYLGQWYRISSREPNYTQCMKTEYSAGENGTIKVFHTFTQRMTQEKSFAKGILHVPDESVSAKLKFRETYEPQKYEGDYSVSGTDYDSFAVVFSCQETNISPPIVLTRELCPTAAVIEKINKVVDKTKVFKSYFKETSPLCKVLEEKNIC